jgi:hypothetical protein
VFAVDAFDGARSAGVVIDVHEDAVEDDEGGLVRDALKFRGVRVLVE